MSPIQHRDIKHSPSAKEDRLASIQAAAYRLKKGVKKCEPDAAFNAVDLMPIRRKSPRIKGNNR